MLIYFFARTSATFCVHAHVANYQTRVPLESCGGRNTSVVLLLAGAEKFPEFFGVRLFNGGGRDCGDLKSEI